MFGVTQAKFGKRLGKSLTLRFGKSLEPAPGLKKCLIGDSFCQLLPGKAGAGGNDVLTPAWRDVQRAQLFQIHADFPALGHSDKSEPIHMGQAEFCRVVGQRGPAAQRPDDGLATDARTSHALKQKAQSYGGSQAQTSLLRILDRRGEVAVAYRQPWQFPLHRLQKWSGTIKIDKPKLGHGTGLMPKHPACATSASIPCAGWNS